MAFSGFFGTRWYHIPFPKIRKRFSSKNDYRNGQIHDISQENPQHLENGQDNFNS
jgi:hypothetical protein